MDIVAQTAMALEAEIAVFQRREILLLQSERYEEWLDLFTDDISYWMPLVANFARREGRERKREDLGLYDEDIHSLRLRIKKMSSTMAWSEDPMSRRRYFVQLLDIHPASDAHGELDVYSNILVYQTRGEKQENYFVGGREDRLRKVGAMWKISRRKIVVDRMIVADRFLNTFF